ncbi:MAG: uroporphyrinogen decarboxylase family protein [Planctomycetota bacterium]|jgi:uroporphyrinogen-III decarboxylase
MQKHDVHDFDPAKYEPRMREAAARLEFREADRVPVTMPVGGSYFARMFGYNIRDYYTDLETNIRAKVRGYEWLFDQLRDDRTGCALHLDLGPVYEGLLFDCTIEFPDDTSPRIVPRLETREDVVKFEPPEIEGHPKVEWVFERWEKFAALAKKIAPRVPVGRPGFGIHPPLSCACAIMDPTRVYEMFYTEPDLLDRFFDRLLESFIRLRDYCDGRMGRKSETLGLADDNSAFISADMYRRHVAPRLKALYDRYGLKWRSLHADGPNDHLFPTIADYLEVNSMDIGGFSSMDAAVAAMKGRTVIEGNMNNRDLYGPLDEKARAKVRHMMRTAGPGGGYVFAIGGEAYVGVPTETMKGLVDYAKEVGRYPIDIPE